MNNLMMYLKVNMKRYSKSRLKLMKQKWKKKQYSGVHDGGEIALKNFWKSHMETYYCRIFLKCTHTSMQKELKCSRPIMGQ